MRTYLAKFAFFLLLLLIGGLGFMLPNILSDQTNASSYPLNVNLDEYCLVQKKACQQNQAILQLSQDSAKALQPTLMTINWPNQEAKQLTLTLRGLEMDLGVVKYTFTKQANGLFTSEIVLPVCTADNMTWIGEIYDEHQENIVKAAIKMHT